MQKSGVAVIAVSLVTVALLCNQYLLVGPGLSPHQTHFTYTLHKVSSHRAKCLDGSPPGYYFARGWGDNVSKFIIYFQGGAWITGKTIKELLKSAQQRSDGILGSSTQWGKEDDWNQNTLTRSGNILSRNMHDNPHFYNWNTVFVNYCDGTGHQGYREKPIVKNQRRLYFRGEENVIAILGELRKQHGLDDAKLVLLSGGSAGGLAVLQWVNYFRSVLPPRIRLLAAPDSTLFGEKSPYQSERPPLIETHYLNGMMRLVNNWTDPVNVECVADNPGEKWKCMQPSTLLKYAKVPMFLIQSLSDRFAIKFLGLLPCTDFLETPEAQYCDEEELAYVQDYGEYVQELVTFYVRNNPGSGGWLSSCLFHWYPVMLIHSILESKSFNTFKSNDGLVLADHLHAWITKQESQVSIDATPWIENTLCDAMVRD